ncbi:MAG TPA: cytochrome c biogenesis protein CcdA [Firmicutes bacterium]|nr:cytochrome c biogenesis protein CcdA [Candidatus Fermentithermobacillaceae bacterium]
MLTDQLNHPVLGPIYALVAGILTSASPCAIGAMPLLVGHMAGARGKARGRDLALFVLGMSVSLTAAGLVAGLLGRSISLSAPWLRVVAGAGFLVLGLVYLGVFEGSRTCPVPSGALSQEGQRTWLTSVSMGLMYGISASPCATPALITILALVATTGSVLRGGSLLLAYSLGQSMLVIAAGLATSRLRDFLSFGKNASILPLLRKIGGAIIFAFGLYMLLTQSGLL